MLNNNLASTRQRHGLSLIEIMIAMVMTLIVLGAMMAAFSYGSAEMQKGRAMIELNNRLITSEEQLRRDLDRITVEVKPHHKKPALPNGFFEIVDGPQTDYIAGNDTPFTVGATTYGTTFSHGGNELVYGDRDDYLGFTIKSDGKAFRGRNGNNIVESHLAEVAWFCINTPGMDSPPGSSENRMVCRRQLLILPSLGVLLTSPTAADVNSFFAQNDISARIDSAGNLVANTLADLGIRGNRYCHTSGAVDPSLNTLLTGDFPLKSNANHIMFSSVAAFDVQVFSPDADLRYILDGASPPNIVDIAENSDICAASERAGLLIGTVTPESGAYTDLGKGTGLLGRTANARYSEQVYDTGSSQYNRNAPNDAGANGIDDDSDGVVDEPNEGNAVPPYNAEIRGIKIVMRAIESNTNQVRQLTVKKSFVPE
ncbi:PilW family protein [Mariniblastus fucicola]|uniref:Prepilin-type N-terminal cleavage/methylation domain-containing protein n=1 Tax=Mariniblastus fucicola TaxID=980251 RepID=A0A5B9PBX6_9BACT|nr:prepilin-type N-terminal cleavage/methylation domain-containing protein [Mariniblastus fucicola]QEG20611.1 hypothetical protein MFFC18_04610 [Mariniblastus fucicola]